MRAITEFEFWVAEFVLRSVGPIPSEVRDLSKWKRRVVRLTGYGRVRVIVHALARGIRLEKALERYYRKEIRRSPLYSRTHRLCVWPCGGGRRVVDKPVNEG